jgi:uncharacterized damage-inducible protein DinB
MKAYLVVFALFLAPLAMIQAQIDRLFLESMKEKWAHAEDYIIACAEMMPSEKYDFKATPEVATFKKQLMHSLQNITWITTSYLGGEKISSDVSTADPTKDELIGLLRQAFDKASLAINNLTAEDLTKKVDFFAGEKTVLQMLELMDDHLTHHKGQLVVYLRLNGLTPPRFVGW